ncbi:MAG: zinc metallopeptidase [Planctomycetota bacterium]
MEFLLLLIAPMLLAGWASWRVKSTFKKFSQVGVASGMTGAQAAAAVCRAGGAHDVTIERIGGFLSDHYDPRTKTLRLSPDVYDGRSVSAIAVGAHEAGHALQHATNYTWLEMRSLMVPAVQFGNATWIYPVMAGMLLSNVGFMWVGIALLAVTVLFQLVTLPVEFDASNRAKHVLATGGITRGPDEEAGVAKVLDAAAMTYVAGAVASIATLLYYVMIATQNRD